MYEESDKKFLSGNIVLLILKLVLLVIFVFIICWLFLNNNNKKKETTKNVDSTFIANINSMKDAAFGYFTDELLPSKSGQIAKLTLEEMINKKLLVDFTQNGKTCNLTESYVEVTKTSDENYALKVNLDCNNGSDFIVSNIEKESKACTTCPVTNQNDTNNDNNNSSNTTDNNTNNNVNNNSSSSSNNENNSSTNNSTSSNSNNNNKTTIVKKVTYKYYNLCSTCNDTKQEEPKKEPKIYNLYEIYSYTDWVDGTKAGPNYENKCEEVKTYNYCKTGELDYYMSCFFPTTYNKNSYSKTLYLNQLDYKTMEPYETVANYYTSIDDYDAFLKQINKNNDENKDVVKNPQDMANSTLSSNDYKFTYSQVYRSGLYYKVDFNVTISDNAKINPYYSEYLKQNVYFAPIKFNVKFKKLDSCVRDLETNKNNYNGYEAFDEENSRVCKHREKIYNWVSDQEIDKYLNDGWIKTGKVVQRTI